MGLSVIATYGIVFTASLLMFGMLLNSFLYSYSQFNSGINNKVSIIESTKNVMKIERIVYNQSHIDILAINMGPKTEDLESLTVLVNGTIVPLNYTGVWYPGEELTLKVNYTGYSMGTVHQLQFTVAPGIEPIASAEYDKIYLLNATGIYAYYYSGTLAWHTAVQGPRDLSIGTYIYVLNATGIDVFDLSGQELRFLPLANISHIASHGSLLYALNSTSLQVLTDTGTVEKEIGMADGRDVTAGSEVYVLDGTTVKSYNYTGTYLSSFTDSRLYDSTKITAAPNASGLLFVLTSHGEILAYRGSEYIGSIPLSVQVSDISLYGKLYLCSDGLQAMDIGYPVKLVDEFGNGVYDYL